MYIYVILHVLFYFFFFFKQKTAYEIYQCDWSSDVCSSDLAMPMGFCFIFINNFIFNLYIILIRSRISLPCMTEILLPLKAWCVLPGCIHICISGHISFLSLEDTEGHNIPILYLSTYNFLENSPHHHGSTQNPLLPYHSTSVLLESQSLHQYYSSSRWRSLRYFMTLETGFSYPKTVIPACF